MLRGLMPRYLGLDSSTQSLSALVVDTDTGRVVLDETINFGKELPEFGSPNGFLPNADERVKHSNPLMWVTAIDRLFSRIKASGFDFGSIAGISGAGQQHGSVYLRTPITDAAPWSERQELAEQVRPLLSRATSPFSMTRSTCRP